MDHFGKKDEDKKRLRDSQEDTKEKRQTLEKTPSQSNAVSLLSPNDSSSKVGTISGTKDKSATFAVWNLWDLGGGPRASHWTESALSKLPGELAKIEADVIGLLEIKTGHTSASRAKMVIPVNAFQMGRLAGLIFRSYIKQLDQDVSLPQKRFSEIFAELGKMMWVGENEEELEQQYTKEETPPQIWAKRLEPVLKLQEGFASVGNLEETVHIGDLKEIVNELVFSDSNDFIYTLWENNFKELYFEMSVTSEKFPNTRFKPVTEINQQGMTEYMFWKNNTALLTKTWEEIQEAFENRNTVVDSPQTDSPNNEAKGIEIIEPILETFKTNCSIAKKPVLYEKVVLPKVPKDGETTAFVYNTSKFRICCAGAIPIKGEGWQFRSPGYIHLICLPGVLKEKHLMVVAWHAPSENHAGERWEAYTMLNKKLINRAEIKGCLKKTNVILLADMNIRAVPVWYEEGIVEAAYDCWLPSAPSHMSLCTSLTTKGVGKSQWNHPFDKVLLLNQEKLGLVIGAPEKMDESTDAKTKRELSDHSWVKAEISLEPKYHFL